MLRLGRIILLFVALGWIAAPRPGVAETAGPPPGYARIWVYRYDEPYVSLATPYVRFNGRIVGVSKPGAAFYRDVPPGEYYVTVDSEGRDVNQYAHIEVAVSKYWDCGGGARGGGWCRDTFYTRLQPPRIGAFAVYALPLTGIAE